MALRLRIMGNRVLDWMNTTTEVRDAEVELAILPLASVEQHGSHLPVGTDLIVMERIARRVAESLKGRCYLLPTFPFGTSGSHLGMAGTISLEWPTLMGVVIDLVDSLLTQGISKIAVLNNHGCASGDRAVPVGNEIVKATVRQLNYDHPELMAIWVQPFAVAGQELASILQSTGDDIHAGELETSLLLYLGPEMVIESSEDFVPQVNKDWLRCVPFRKISPRGIWGKPSLSSAKTGKRALEVVVKGTVEYIERAFEQLESIKRGI